MKSSFALENESLILSGLGCFNLIKGEKYPLFEVEYRSSSEIYRRKYVWIRPLLGAFITTKASTYIYGGIAFDVFLGEKIAFTPSFAPGVYFQGKGKNLGYPLEFRSSVELSYIFKNKGRLGAQFYHISNGSFGTANPGTECLVGFYAFPIP